jgi:hypothetical protein
LLDLIIKTYPETSGRSKKCIEKPLESTELMPTQFLDCFKATYQPKQHK